MNIAAPRSIALLCVAGSLFMGNGFRPESSHAQPRKFACAQTSGKYATVAKTKKGEVPIIAWESDDYSGSGFTPQVRCKKVSDRFQSLYTSGQLKYITIGKIKNLAVVCGTTSAKATCTPKNVLYTLKPTADPQKVLSQLRNLRNRATRSAVEESASRPGEEEQANSIDTEWLEDD
jgi:hypothetical protein